MPRLLVIFASFLPVTFLSLPATGTETYSYPYAFLSRVEGEVSLQRASEPEPQPGAINLPVLPGDRIWTHAGSRAEVRFTNGTLLRLDEGTKVDFVELDSGILLRAWSGSVILRIDDLVGTVRVDSPAGSVTPSTAGSYRIDVDPSGQTLLSVSHGSADFVSSLGSALVESGQSSALSVGEPPGAVVPFNTASFDAFDAWSDALDRWAPPPGGVVVRSLPHEIDGYSSTLDQYGSWGQEPTYGSVWYPQVSAGWAPYQYGRWCNTRFGYTWVSSEPWGWAPYHYGRWGFGHRGWFWIPGASWSPAWVSFAVGSFWVGWSPLGFHDQPVFHFDPFRHGQHGFPHGGGQHGFPHGGGWNFTTRDDFRRGRSMHRLDSSLVEATASGSDARILESGDALHRELNPDRWRGSASKRSETRARVSTYTRPENPRTFAPSTTGRERTWTNGSAFGRRGSPTGRLDESSRDRSSSMSPSPPPSPPTATSSPSLSSRREQPSAFDRNPSGRAFIRPEPRSGSTGTMPNGSNGTNGVFLPNRSGVRQGSSRPSTGFTSSMGRGATSAGGSDRPSPAAPRSGYRGDSGARSAPSPSWVDRGSSRSGGAPSGSSAAGPRNSRGSSGSHAGASNGGGRGSARSGSRRY